MDAICEAVEAAGEEVVVAVHSGAGAPGYAATDRIAEHLPISHWPMWSRPDDLAAILSKLARSAD